MEQEIKRDGAAEDFGQITGADGDFAHQPVGPARPARGPVAAALGEIFSGNDAEARRDHLHEDGHEAGETDDPEQSVFELRPALQIGSPVTRVHVSDADQDGWADEGFPLLPEAGLMMGNLDGTVDIFQRTMSGGRDSVGCHGV